MLTLEWPYYSIALNETKKCIIYTHVIFQRREAIHKMSKYPKNATQIKVDNKVVYDNKQNEIYFLLLTSRRQ